MKAQTVGVGATCLEANAATKNIIRKGSREVCMAYFNRQIREDSLSGEFDR